MWCVFLMRGTKVLFKIALGVIKMIEADISKATSVKEILEIFSSAGKRSCETLIPSNVESLRKFLDSTMEMKITNRMLKGLEKIYEIHPAYMLDSLTIMLFRNRHLNDAFDWKILPQAPHANINEQVAERLNKQSM